MQKLYLFLFIAFYSCSSGQKSLVGEWKPFKVTIRNSFGNKLLVLYDNDNQDSIKENLFKKYFLESATDTEDVEEDVEEIDTSEFRKTLDCEFIKFDSARLILKNDSSILINSYGLIIPTALPGWHFGDKIGGKWTQQQNKLKFIIGDSKNNYPFFYKIIKQTSDSLIIAMVSEDYEDETMNLEFVRQ